MQVFLLFIPNVIHQSTDLTETCASINTTTNLTDTARFPGNVTSLATNRMSLPVNVTMENITTFHCTLHFSDTTSTFALACDTIKKSENSSLLQRTNSCLDIRWNCSTFLLEEFTNDSYCDHQEIQVPQNLSKNICNGNDSIQEFTLVRVCDSKTMRLSCNQLAIDLPKSRRVHKKFGVTFWAYFSIFGSASFLMNPIWPLLNAIAYTLLGTQRNAWGKQRLWGENQYLHYKSNK